MPIRKQLKATLLEKAVSLDFWFPVILYVCLFISLLPITKWVASSTSEQSRILHALIVLLFACALLIRFGNIKMIQPLTFNQPARTYLYIAYGLLITSFTVQLIGPLKESISSSVLSLILIPAYCFALGSLILFVFGEGTRRLTRTATLTFCAFLFLSILMQPLDWPLRTLAGQWSGSALALIGQTVEFGINKEDGTGAPQLLMYVNEHPFHVASECNGFGIMLTSLLLALLLAIYRRLGPLDIALNLVTGIIFGFVFNTLRIVIIVLLAPSLMEHYHLMHEIVGTITYWGCLATLWILLNGPVNDEPLTA